MVKIKAATGRGKVALNSKMAKNFLAKKRSTIFDQNLGRQPEVFVKIFGCQQKKWWILTSSDTIK